MKVFLTVMRTLSSLFLALISTMIFVGCKKSTSKDPCEGAVLRKADFYFKENLSDTAFISDTIFQDNYVTFETSGSYNSTLWKIGSDPRDFSAPSFTLSFANFLGTIDINFTGRSIANTQCFPSDSGVYSGTKKLTIVEQIEKPQITLSPMIGKYKGAYRETPQDSFVVSIDYFDSSKYDASTTGSKNFYWISNMPKGYIDTTSSPVLAYPELKYGMSPEMGYKCLQFGDLGNILKGRGFAKLSNDSLIVYYNHIGTGRKLFIGRRI